jgi:hypothetical protein
MTPGLAAIFTRILAAANIFDAVREAIARETDERRHDLFWRQPEKTVRVATILAACRFDKCVSRSDMEWALAYVTAGDETLLEAMNEYAEEEKLTFNQLVKELIRRVKRAGGMESKRTLQRSLQNNVQWKKQLAEAFEHAEDTEQLVALKVPPQDGIGRPSIWFALPEVAKAEYGWTPSAGHDD